MYDCRLFKIYEYTCTPKEEHKHHSGEGEARRAQWLLQTLGVVLILRKSPRSLGKSDFPRPTNNTEDHATGWCSRRVSAEMENIFTEHRLPKNRMEIIKILPAGKYAREHFGTVLAIRWKKVDRRMRGRELRAR